MSFNAVVGSFTVPGTGGNNPVVTGLPFQPKAIILFGNTRTTDGKSSSTGTNADMPLTVLGMATGPSNQAALVSNDDFSGGDVGFEGSNCLFLANGAGTTVTSATLVSLDAGGFTLDFTFVDGTAHVINYLALGGSDLSANVVHFTPPSSNNASFAITGAGFKPTGVIFAGGQSGISTTGGMGFTDGTHQGTNSSYFGGSGFHEELTSAAYLDVNRQLANIVSLDTDGCTLDFTDTVSGELGAALFLAGIDVHVGSFNTLTTAGNQTITGVGFTPSAVLFSSVAEATSATAGTNWILRTIGAADGTNQATVWASDWNHGNASLDRTHVLHYLNDDATPSDMVLASLSSFNSDGFVLDYTTVNATARETLFMAMGAASGGGGVALTAKDRAGSKDSASLSVGTPVTLTAKDRAGSKDTAVMMVIVPTMQAIDLAGSSDRATLTFAPRFPALDRAVSRDAATLSVKVPLTALDRAATKDSASLKVAIPLPALDRAVSRDVASLSTATAFSPLDRAVSRDSAALSVKVPLTGADRAGSRDFASLTAGANVINLSGLDRAGSTDKATLSVSVPLIASDRAGTRDLASMAVAVHLVGSDRAVTRDSATFASPGPGAVLFNPVDSAKAKDQATLTVGIPLLGYDLSRARDVAGFESPQMPIHLAVVDHAGSLDVATLSVAFPLTPHDRAATRDSALLTVVLNTIASANLTAADDPLLTLQAGDPLIGPYDPGQVIVMSLTARDQDGNLVDPDTVGCDVASIETFPTVATVEVDRLSTGTYSASFEIPDVPGPWFYRFVTASPDGAVKRYFRVNA